MTTLFISDLHLDPSRPAITELFLAFLRDEAMQADALYILGDLFEAWIGDDTPSAAANWVLVNGETETGVTLHRMVKRAVLPPPSQPFSTTATLVMPCSLARFDSASPGPISPGRRRLW